MIRAPSFQLMPKIRFMPAPVPDTFPRVKNRHDRNSAIPQNPAAAPP